MWTDTERFALELICVVKYGSPGGTATASEIRNMVRHLNERIETGNWPKTVATLEPPVRPKPAICPPGPAIAAPTPASTSPSMLVVAPPAPRPTIAAVVAPPILSAPKIK